MGWVLHTLLFNMTLHVHWSVGWAGISTSLLLSKDLLFTLLFMFCVLQVCDQELSPQPSQTGFIRHVKCPPFCKSNPSQPNQTTRSHLQRVRLTLQVKLFAMLKFSIAKFTFFGQIIIKSSCHYTFFHASTFL